MAIVVKLFAQYRDLLGKTEVTVQSRPGQTVGDVFGETIGEHAHPELRDSTMFAVNEKYASPETVVKDGDRVAFIPPVSGG